MKSPNLTLILPLAGALLAGNSSFAAERCVFPEDPSVLDVKRDFGAKGDGVADDTAALQAAIAASSNRGKDGGTKILYLPNGIYRVSSNLVVQMSVGPWVHGESRDGVVTRLADGVPTNVTAVLRTHPRLSGCELFLSQLYPMSPPQDPANRPFPLSRYRISFGILRIFLGTPIM